MGRGRGAALDGSVALVNASRMSPSGKSLKVNVPIVTMNGNQLACLRRHVSQLNEGGLA
jgi:hypothetical protein